MFNKMISIFALLIFVTAFGAAHTSSSFIDLKPKVSIESLLDRLAKDSITVIDFAVIDDLENIIARIPAEKIEQLLLILTRAGEQGVVLNQRILKRALMCIEVSLRTDDEDISIELSNEILPSESTTWNMCKKFVIGFSVSAVGTYAATKAFLYYRSRHS